MEYALYYPTPWEQVDAENDNIDVCMTFPDGRSYTFVVATLENIKRLMEAEGKPYLFPGTPILIVRRLTEDVVAQLMVEMAGDDKLLKLYGSDLSMHR